jgi:hypothetical protein
MTQREELGAGGGTFSDTMHIVLSALTVLLILSQIGFGAAAFSKRFRFYSILTAATVLVFGAKTGLYSPRLAAGDPTPWLGLVERISIGAWLLWMAVVATALLRDRTLAQGDGPDTRGELLENRLLLDLSVEGRPPGEVAAQYEHQLSPARTRSVRLRGGVSGLRLHQQGRLILARPRLERR